LEAKRKSRVARPSAQDCKDHENNRITLVVIGSVLARSSEGAEVEQSLALTGPASGPAATFATQAAGIWQREVGEGFRPGVRTLSLEAGGAGGFVAFGGRQAHDFALTSVSYGCMLGEVAGQGRWYRGNWESAPSFSAVCRFLLHAIGWLD